MFRNLPPGYKDTGLYLAVLPSDHAALANHSGAVFKRDAGGKVINLSYDGQPLPELPALGWAAFKQSLFEIPRF